MSNRNFHAAQRTDKRRAHLNKLAAEEQREQERDFREMNIMQQPRPAAAPADVAKLAARVSILEAVQQQAFDQALVKHDARARKLAIMALAVAAIALCIAGVDLALRIGLLHL